MKKTVSLLSLLIYLGLNLYAQTPVEGEQSGSWLSENSPYEVIGEITVPAGETLSIEAGVEVNFQAHYKFTVFGNLQALGTIEDSIYFTTDLPETGWGGIRFIDSEGMNNLDYCRIEFGKSSGDYPDMHGGAMALLNANVMITNTVFADNDATADDNGMGGAIYGINTGSPSKFIDCSFIRNHAYGEGGAIKFTSDLGTEFIGCQFLNNDCLYGGGAISLYSVIGTKMTYCLFADNYTMYANGGAVHTLGGGNTLFFENCTLTGNEAVTGEGGAVVLAYANGTFTNTIIYDNPGVYGDDVFLSIAGEASMNYCHANLPDGATGSNNINGNPLFIDANNQDYNLQETSACIDAGTDIGYEFYGEAPDMGCYEYDPTTALKEIISTELKIYPNPAQDIISIDGDLIIESYWITDISGKVVVQELNTKNLNVDISNLKKGYYFLNISSDQGQIRAQSFLKL
ncbi:MAG: T9SS type A sorting domain-containing protein [Bacteroidales bacterium]|nr:T9SS type A sorting domain-containing protein [Bacteroidales bacterium]